MTTELAPIPKAFRDPTDGFAKGWYCVAEADDVSADAMLPVAYLGQQLIVYRDPSGAAQVADAFCPHLGAHLASADGCIDDGEIVCPFHKWRFATTDGVCASIPYSTTIPPRAKLTTYPTIEQNGMVFLWWHPAGREPEAPPFDGFSADDERRWVKHTDKVFLTQVPLRDLHENAFDTAHIQQLHRSTAIPEIESVVRRPHGLEINVGESSDVHETGIRSMQFNFSGLGVANLTVSGDRFGMMSIATATPIDEEQTHMHVRLYVADTGSADMNDLLGRGFADRVSMEIDQDMAVLNFKKHVPKPVLCRGDGPVMKWRRYVDELLAG